MMKKSNEARMLTSYVSMIMKMECNVEEKENFNTLFQNYFLY